MRIGFIGTGGIAAAHMKALQEMEDVEFAAMCDIDEEKAQGRAEEFGGTAYSDFHRMYDKEELDAVYISTPPFAHGDIELMACERGIPMFIEKPVDVDMGRASKIGEAIRNSGVIVSVGYHWRYSAGCRYVRQVLADEPMILGALGSWIGGMPGTPWWRVRAQSGGQHVEQTTHIFDLARYVIGSEAKAVHGLAVSGSMTDVPGYDVDDMSVVNIHFENGAIANIVSCCAMKGFGRAKLEVLCRGLVVGITGGSVSVNRAGEEEEIPELEGSDRDRVFIDAVKTGDGSGILSTYDDAVKTLGIMLAASESFETGKVVELQ